MIIFSFELCDTFGCTLFCFPHGDGGKLVLSSSHALFRIIMLTTPTEKCVWVEGRRKRVREARMSHSEGDIRLSWVQEVDGAWGSFKRVLCWDGVGAVLLPFHTDINIIHVQVLIFLLGILPLGRIPHSLSVYRALLGVSLTHSACSGALNNHIYYFKIGLRFFMKKVSPTWSIFS